MGAFVDAVRWGAVTSADAKAYQAPFRSGATLEPYQLEPLRRALEAARTNLLLADDVGLGKTIEAGLAIEELLLRHRARSVIIVCPPSLALKWRDEMREKFGLEFVIVDSARIAADRRTYGLAANPLRLYPRVIVSMAWLPGVRAQRLLREVLDDAGRPGSARNYAFDVLVVDEAHHVAPAAPSAVGGGRGYAVDSQRTRALRRLAEKCEHRLFLSATPHNGYTESFTALLEMIDPRRFARGAEIDRSALDEVTVRRLKADVPDRDFNRRKVNSVEYAAAADEEEAYAKLDSLLRASGRQQGRRSLDIATLLLKKRFLSSPWAFARTLGNYLTDPVAAGRRRRAWVGPERGPGAGRRCEPGGGRDPDAGARGCGGVAATSSAGADGPGRARHVGAGTDRGGAARHRGRAGAPDLRHPGVDGSRRAWSFWGDGAPDRAYPRAGDAGR
ncbi:MULTISPECIES: SNF2-related protein [unclassified Actinomyces]|uniref:SNF2-related protein n=1 Tax=unclassified Actinomyces TaxID=2609248 RepID=UPI002D769410|nr:SNF2-related protein [Actinomyces sp. Z16]